MHDLYYFRWTRPSGSDSDTDEEPLPPAGQPAAVRSASYLSGPNHNPVNVSNANNRVRPHPLAAHAASTPSPQLSLAEFLQDE